VDAAPIFTPSIDKMRDLGLLEENGRWADATERAYTMYMKAFLENYRLDPAVSGYEWWLAWTYLGGSSGILGGNQDNPTAKPGISNATLRSLQQNVILLVKDPVALQSTGRYPDELVPFEIRCANWTFGGDPHWVGGDVRLSWAASVVGGPRLDSGTSAIGRISIAQGEIGPIAAFGVKTPRVTEASKVLVEVTLRVGSVPIAANSWNLAVFPAVAPAKTCSVPVFVEAALLSAAQRICSNAAVVPASLASQAGPFVLVQPDALTAENSAALARTGGSVLLLNPANGWPVCNQSALGPVTVQEVRYNQPWWMDTGLAGTLVYNTTLGRSCPGPPGRLSTISVLPYKSVLYGVFVWARRALNRRKRRFPARAVGFALDDRFLDYSWAGAVDRGQAYTLDHLDAGTARSVHIRAIPAFVDGEFATTVSDTALVWEGKIGSDARFVVSGLNLVNVSENPAQAVKAEPVAKFLFSKLVSYVVSQAAAASTTSTASALDPKRDSEPASFCVAGSELACQPHTVPAGVANANFEIVTRVYLGHDAVVDALHPRLSTRGGGGTLVVPVIYAAASSPATNSTNNSTFCSRTPAGHGSSWGPRRLVAKGPAATLPTAVNATWVRLPLTAPVPLTAGVYWIGLLSSAELNCFADAVAPGKPAALDAYALRSFSSGPGLGPELSWVRGTSNVAVYASTVESDEQDVGGLKTDDDDGQSGTTTERWRPSVATAVVACTNISDCTGQPERDDAELASLTPAASIALAPDAAEGVVAKLPMEYAPMQEGEAVAGTAQRSVGPYHATAIQAVMASANSTCSYDSVSLGSVLKLKTDDASCATWTEPDLYPPPHTASATEVYAVDCTAATNATKLAAATLQGVVNSDQASGARAYLLLAADQPSVGIAGWDRFWLQTFQKRGLMPTSRTTLTPEQFFGKFADAYDAVVVVDTEHLFHTINIATMIAASEERSIVLTPEQLPTLGKGKNVTDLRGRWKSSVAMYSWALQNLYLTGKLAQGTIAYYHPYWLAHHLRDYLIAQKVFVFYISVHDGVAGTALMHEIMTKTAHGTPTQAVSVIGFIGGGPAEDVNAYDEYSGVGLMGNYGKVSTCADWSTNLSYLSSMRHAAKLIESAVAAYRGRVATALSAEQRATPLNKSKVYLSLGVVESGDAPVYWQDRQWQVWNDTKRGSLPISWGVGKGVFEISPAIALYFIEQASGNDYLYGAISGLAYAHPYRSLMGSLPDFEPTWNAYWQRASCYLKRLGATTTGAYTDSWKPFIRAEKDPITKSIAKACGAQCETLVLGMGRDAGRTIANGNYYINDTQVSHVLTRWPANFSATTKAYNVRWLAGDIEAQLAAPGGPMPAPGFLQAMALSWAYGPTEMAEVVAMLPEHMQLVSMQRYSELSRAAAAMKADDEELAAGLPTVATAINASTKQLMLDTTTLFDKISGQAQIVINPLTKRVGELPSILPDQPWETSFDVYNAVIEGQDKVVRVYYGSGYDQTTVSSWARPLLVKPFSSWCSPSDHH
jgi:hypothetical protein